MFLSMNVFLNVSIALVYSTLPEVVNRFKSYREMLRTLMTFSLQVISIAIVQAFINSFMFKPESVSLFKYFSACL